jgi:hypothetical protein
MTSRKAIAVLAFLLTIGASAAACAGDQPATTQPAANAPVVITKSHPGAKVTILSPKNGETVSSPVTVKFGAEGVELAKATDGVKENSGHHHLLLDYEGQPKMKEPLPSNEHVLHYGQAQTETTIELKPGKHTLQLLLADGKHVPLNPPVISKKITIMVK